jgi:Zn-dependent peptidase ImmA (M78 family)
MGIKAPPVPVKKLIKMLGRLFYFYSSQDPEFADEEGFSYLKGRTYYIYINAELPAGRDNFTYAHEIGHIVLGHHKEFHIDNLTEHENWLLNREANVFAANLLMPEEWVRSQIQKDYLALPEIGQLKELFRVSWEAMINRLDELCIQSKVLTYQMFAKRRPAEDLHVEESENDVNGRDPKVKISDIFRFLVCPRCGNNSFSRDALFCRNCGMYLYNDCTSLDCGRHNVPGARYCEYCGAETALLRSGFFEAYESARREIASGRREAAAGSDLPEPDMIKSKAAREGGFDAY